MLKLPYMQQSRPIPVKNLFEEVVSDLTETVPVTRKNLSVSRGFPLPEAMPTRAKDREDLLARAELTMPDRRGALEQLPEAQVTSLIESFNRLSQQSLPCFLDTQGIWHDKAKSTGFDEIAETLNSCQHLLAHFEFGESVDIPMTVATLTNLTQTALSKDLWSIAEAVLASARKIGLEDQLNASLRAESDNLSHWGNMAAIHFLVQAVGQSAFLPKSRSLIGATLANLHKTAFEAMNVADLLRMIEDINPDWLRGTTADVHDISALAGVLLVVKEYLLTKAQSSYQSVLSASLARRSFKGGPWRQG